MKTLCLSVASVHSLTFLPLCPSPHHFLLLYHDAVLFSSLSTKERERGEGEAAGTAQDGQPHPRVGGAVAEGRDRAGEGKKERIP